MKIKNSHIADEKKKRTKLSRHMTVRIPRGMAVEIERFLNTDQAEKMGFDSKADVVTAAIRLLLMEYGYYRQPARTEKKLMVP
jgi:hypothetical protein